VIAVIPTADRSKGTVTVRIAIDQKDPRILPEMGVRVSFLAAAESGSGPAPAGALLPSDAIQSADSNDSSVGVVWIIKEDHVERRAVKLGAKNGSDQTVIAGLIAGERVAVGDFSKLQDGTKIKLEAAP
jgi:multidrug efflux pump subunit AcrA (membrane-fusion protein)